jgi:hypothetical protein
MHAAALQYVRKVSGTLRPSKANEAAFDRAVLRIMRETETLLAELVTTAPPRNRELLREKARARSRRRFG